jgi:NADPH:quinone reductase-like Zn-dependent oxidoreductase/SAM-dependent methyltransferase
VLGRRLSSPLDVVTFEAQIGVDTAGYLDDHRVFGTAILPATAFIEMALSAASQHGGCAALEDVVFHEALVIDDDRLTTVHTVLSPEAGGASLRIFSRADGQDEWKLHVTARLCDGATEPAPVTSIEALRDRCPDEVTAEAHDALLRERGLVFGPSLRGVQRIWTNEEEALGEVALPADQAAEVGRYRVHPALLDAGLQVLADVPALGDETYLPFGIDRVELRGSSPVAQALSHVRLRPDPARPERPETVTADLSLLDESGRPLLAMHGIHFKRADKAALLRAGRRERADDGVYEVVWRQLPSTEVDDAVEDREDAVPTSSLAERLTDRMDELSEEHELDRYEGLLDELDGLSTDYIVVALERLGVVFEPGGRFEATDLGVATRHQDLLLHLLDLLADDGLVRRVGNEWEVVRGRSVDTSDARLAELLQRYPAGRGELMITRRCGERLAEALAGEVDPLQLLFPGGSLENAEEMYQLSPFARFSNALTGEAVVAEVADLPPTRRLRVLEIGAGTGGTSSFVLPRLPADQVEYTFTDVSPHFLGRAGQKFAALPFLDYRPLDIERDPADQGFDGQQFDIVIAANVLHATADLRRTFNHVAKLLAPGGLLVMVEMVRIQRFISITFGLTEGWWKFVDTDLRPSSLLLTADRWVRVLQDFGFAEPTAVPAGGQSASGARGVQAVVMARGPGVSLDQPGQPGGGRWLVVSDRGGVGEAVGAAIDARGGQAVVASPGPAYAQTGRDRFEVDPSRADDLLRLVRDSAGPGFDGVVYLRALDTTGGTASDVMERRLGGALGLTQALAAEGLATRLWFVTRGAQPAADATPDAEQAPLWGFAKTVALEHPELQPRCLDLDPSPAADTVNDLVEVLLSGDDEDQLAVRRGERMAARLVRWAPAPPAEPVELSFAERGTLDHLVLRPAARRPPGPGEIEIRVHATGLNFKDVLNVLGMYPGDPGPVGGECAGVVVAVGPEVTDFHAGDAVVALAPGSFRSHVTCSSALVAPKPTGMSFADAAGLLIANVTADFALRHVGHLDRGERALIHAGAGGVGLAAIGLAQRCGAEVYATAGSEHKRALLASLGVAHVYDSRSLAFADQILADTCGEGVDVVLNSLAGEFVTRSLDLLREDGRFLEIGKRDHLTADAAAELGRGRTYHVIDWGETAREDPALIRSIVMDVVAAASSGQLPATPITTFPLSDARTAFRFMAQARHIGKVVVTQPEAANDRPPPPINSEATYLITGGLGGLGLLTARQLVQSGARHLALMGRREPSEAVCKEIAALEAEGAAVVVIRGDVSSRTDVERVLKQISATMPPLRGVFHSAGALDDGALGQQTWARFDAVLSAKVDGARHLDELTAGAELDHFVLYSSIASMIGSPGQANHAAANAFLDALAHRRATLGRPGLSINWGAWSEIGAAAERGVDKRVADLGIGVIRPAEGMERLGQLMGQAAPQVGVVPAEWPVLLRRYGEGRPPPYFSELTPTVRPEAVVAAPARQVDLLRELADAAPNRRAGIVLDLVRDQSAHVLDLPPEQVDDRAPLSELGLDSLMAVELRNLLGASLGMSRPLPATLVFDYPTVTAITRYLVDEVLGFDGSDRATPEDSTTESAPSEGALVSALLDDLEHLSDDHIERMLELRTRR